MKFVAGCSLIPSSINVTLCSKISQTQEHADNSGNYVGECRALGPRSKLGLTPARSVAVLSALQNAGMSEILPTLVVSTRASINTSVLSSNDYNRSKKRHNHAIRLNPLLSPTSASLFGLIECFVSPLAISPSSVAAIVNVLEVNAQSDIIHLESSVPEAISRHLPGVIRQQLWLRVSTKPDVLEVVPLENIVDKCVYLELSDHVVISFLPNKVEID